MIIVGEKYEEGREGDPYSFLFYICLAYYNYKIVSILMVHQKRFGRKHGSQCKILIAFRLIMEKGENPNSNIDHFTEADYNDIVLDWNAEIFISWQTTNAKGVVIILN